MAKGRGPEIDEATVLFEVVLPHLCEKYAEGLQKLGPERQVELRLRARPPRAWVVSGGEPPWIRRGQVESGEPALVVTVSPELVKLVVHGGEPDLEAAIASGDLELNGKLDFFAELGFDVEALSR